MDSLRCKIARHWSRSNRTYKTVHALPSENPLINDDAFLCSIEYLLNVFPTFLVFNMDLNMLGVFRRASFIKDGHADTVPCHALEES